ncbi:MAG TPA: DEAD/DEAH box helicase, partial [Anaeromyxobacteraceae bacterium]|nr:DEAD/DEAH box helicase [Anaeromyxobacteraceae bacterium]
VTCDGFAGLRALVDPPPRHAPRRAAFAGGRWSLLRSPRPAGGEAGAAPDRDELVAAMARQYLRRYGVVFRDLLTREAGAPPWRELVRVYRTEEARGSLRGGRFVAGFSGEQFALPEAVEALRAARRAPKDGSERVEVSAADPLNLVGIVTPGPRIAAGLANRVRYADGLPVGGADGRDVRTGEARG